MKIVISSTGTSSLDRPGLPFLTLAIFAIAASVFFFFPDRLSLATYVVIFALFALSLDLALGIAGIVTLGHAVFFGIGAYTAGWLALGGWQEPISGVLIAASCAAVVAAALGPMILRLTGLPLVMVTLAIGILFFEAANKLTWLTGGDDGLYGMRFDPILGMFHWSIFGHVEYIYALVWLAVAFFVCQRVASSNFGLALRGIRENNLRMSLLGSSVRTKLTLAYTISAFIAGIAGALLAQTTEFVGLEVFSLETSIDAVVIVILGGVGHLYGAMIGAPVYLLIKDLSKEWNPHAWKIIIGGLLIFVMLFARGGVHGLLHTMSSKLRNYFSVGRLK